MNGSSSSAAAVVPGVVGGLVVYVLYAVALWRIFDKADYPGWLALIPVANAVYFVKVGGRSGWFAVLYLIPIVNIIVHWFVSLWVSRSFGHGYGYAAGLFFLPLIFSYILAFDSSQHRSSGEYGPSRHHRSQPATA